MHLDQIRQYPRSKVFRTRNMKVDLELFTVNILIINNSTNINSNTCVVTWDQMNTFHQHLIIMPVALCHKVVVMLLRQRDR